MIKNISTSSENIFDICSKIFRKKWNNQCYGSLPQLWIIKMILNNMIGGWEESEDGFTNKQNFTGYLELYEVMKEEILTSYNTKYSKTFSDVDEVIEFLKSLPEEDLRDDGDYSKAKFTIIPAGTGFLTRQNVAEFDKIPSPVRLEYIQVHMVQIFHF